MEVKVKNELLLINILGVLLIPAILLSPSNILRVALGLPFLLFFPGYCLMALAAPGKGDLSLLSRVGLSLGLSAFAFPLVGLLLHYTPWGITVASTVISLGLLILAFSVAAWYRRRRLPEEERLVWSFYNPVAQWRSSGGWDKALSLLLALSILFGFGAIGYTALSIKNQERFTEFYTVGLWGMAGSYPFEVREGDVTKVTIGIINREGKTTRYQVEALVDGERVSKTLSVALEDGEKSEQEMALPALKPGAKKAEFLLYREGEPEPYESTYLWLEVKGKEEEFTEFYAGYPPKQEIVEGKTIIVQVKLVSHEKEAMKYQVYIVPGWVPMEKVTVLKPELEPGQAWEGESEVFLKVKWHRSLNFSLVKGDKPLIFPYTNYYKKISLDLYIEPTADWIKDQ